MVRKTLGFIVALMVVYAQAAHASSEKTADAFVNSLFEGFTAIFRHPQADVDGAFLRYYEDNFDNARISRSILGNWSRRASKDQVAHFSKLLPKHLCRQIGPQINKYFSAGNAQTKIVMLQVRELKKQRLLIDVRYEGLRDLNVQLLLNPDGDSFKILDVKIADISMLLAQRDQISQLIRHNDNNIDRFLTVLEENNRPKCIEQPS